MKKNKIILFATLLASSVASAQNTFPTTGNVGIGTTSPTEKLEINGGSIRIVDNNPGNRIMWYRTDNTQATGIASDGLSTMRFIRGGSEEMTFNGYLGIGITTPTHKLTVANGGIRTYDFFAGTGVYVGADGISQPTIGFNVANNDQRFRLGVYGVDSENERMSILTASGGTVAYNEVFSVNKTGRIGVGTNTPLAQLHINNNGENINSSSQYSQNAIVVQSNTGGRSTTTGAALEFAIPANTTQGGGGNVWGQSRIITVAGNNENGDATGKMILGTRRNFFKNGLPQAWYYGDDLVIDGSGNVGINTSTPSEKLAVNGKIRAKEVRVEAVNWPDYVFEDEYKRTDLVDLEKFIKINKHLPEMPSAKEVETNGLALGEMNRLLLKKVEELTLYLIEKDKALKVSNEKLQHLEDSNKETQQLLKEIQLKLGITGSNK